MVGTTTVLTGISSREDAWKPQRETFSAGTARVSTQLNLNIALFDEKAKKAGGGGGEEAWV